MRRPCLYRVLRPRIHFDEGPKKRMIRTEQPVGRYPTPGSTTPTLQQGRPSTGRMKNGMREILFPATTVLCPPPSLLCTRYSTRPTPGVAQNSYPKHSPPQFGSARFVRSRPVHPHCAPFTWTNPAPHGANALDPLALVLRDGKERNSLQPPRHGCFPCRHAYGRADCWRLNDTSCMQYIL
jgi:hypothetical protein